MGSLLLLGVSFLSPPSNIHRVRCFATTRDESTNLHIITRRRRRHHHPQQEHGSANSFNNIVNILGHKPGSKINRNNRDGYGIINSMKGSSSAHRIGNCKNRRQHANEWSVLHAKGGAQEDGLKHQQGDDDADDGAASSKKSLPGAWPCFDEIDKDLIRFSLPVIGNYAINPLIGAVDLFWVNRMGNALAVTGQAAANQVFSSAVWFVSFLQNSLRPSMNTSTHHDKFPTKKTKVMVSHSSRPSLRLWFLLLLLLLLIQDVWPIAPSSSSSSVGFTTTRAIAQLRLPQSRLGTVCSSGWKSPYHHHGRSPGSGGFGSKLGQCWTSSSSTSIVDWTYIRSSPILLTARATIGDLEDPHNSDVDRVVEGTTDVYDVDDDNIDYVSDAEALLACWSFLQWRRRLGNLTTSKGVKSSGSSSSVSSTVPVPGTTADDHHALTKRGRQKRTPPITLERPNNNFFLLEGEDLNSHLDDDDGVGNDTDDVYGGTDYNGGRMKPKWEFEIASLMKTSQGEDVMSAIGDKGDDGDGEDKINVFTAFPTKPSESSLRRSRALRKVWDDPDYRTRWYELRWGSRPRRTKDQSLRERTAERRARALPPGFLGSEELASLTEEEIAQAIQTRVQSTQRRVSTRKQTLRERRDLLARQAEELSQTLSSAVNERELEQQPSAPATTPPRLARDVLFTRTREELEAKRMERSDRAKRLYSTRMQNQKRVKDVATKTLAASAEGTRGMTAVRSAAQVRVDAAALRPLFPPKQLSPRDAFLRAEHQLDMGQKPSVQDIRLILQPTAMKQRKELLRRILDEVFDVRGKCVPIQQQRCVGSDPYQGNKITKIRRPTPGNDNNNNDTSPICYEFVTHAKIADLGNFVISLLKGHNNNDDAEECRE